ncbi:glutaredoxin family protein [Kocuria sp.]|uniref:glutaredoxin family protein n=1 Tax=Kocuria sp. TaxID=1871328 RepID=UPI0026E10E68|nr:glutaredoxin family protein [Kocuria sp.]MDO5619291.1 glutaredoxin family protein [Kocuria sp.]
MSQHVTVYTQPGCQPCRATTRWLKKHRVQPTTVDVTQSPADLEAVKALGYQESPVVVVSHGPGNDVHWSGYRPDLLAEHITTERRAA